jgi:hypothetical protein
MILLTYHPSLDEPFSSIRELRSGINLIEAQRMHIRAARRAANTWLALHHLAKANSVALLIKTKEQP